MSIHDIISEMSRTAEAAARVPELETQVRNLTIERDRAQVHGQELESHIVSYKARIDDLTSKLRQAEADRDEAAFRNLEADEFRSKLRALLGDDGSASRIAELEAKVKAAEDDAQSHAQRVTELEEERAKAAAEAKSNADNTYQRGPHYEPEVQRAPIPTATASTNPEPNVSSGNLDPALSIVHGMNESPAPTADPSPPLPYAGKLYINHPGWVSRNDWLAGGGTDETYDWRDNSTNALPYGVTSRTA